ncbi:AraC family transcriptional regulator [Tenacibaculum agarivorans]|uniref:AraC family transcriptional regulator n=1 Tax=Tenacibaculum agarivorans TaxID=1908389 RepID=UPI00094B9641|nr:AraC family transcriptional regulator [Tenacibaculum agarivorans]
MKKIKFFSSKAIFFLLLIISFESYSQNQTDTLSNKSFRELSDKFNSNLKDTNKLNLYARAFLKKSKLEFDTLRIARGYHYFYFINKENSIGLLYLDSIIRVTNKKKYELYPLTAYNLKGRYYFNIHNYEKSLEYLFKVKEVNQKQYYSDEVEVQINHFIGLIKSRLGEYREALNLFLNNKKYISNKDTQLLITYYAIADSYRFLKKLDSSSYYNKLGIKEALKQKNKSLYNYFLLNEGATLSKKRLYLKSIDSIKKSLPEIINLDDKQNIAMGYFFLGKNNYALNKKQEAINYFKKVDSIYHLTNDIHPELREGYEIIINELKLNHNIKDELIYVNKLLELDSKLSDNYKVLSKKISQEFDTPRLLKEKDKLIQKISAVNKNYSISTYLLILTLFIVLIYLIHLFYKKKSYERKLEKLLSKSHEEKKIISKTDDTFNINQKVVSDVLSSLEKFESNRDFLNNKITAYSLAKKLNTNTQYLSKIINHYKRESFISYVNNLRINYATEKILNDTTFRKFTISAIAIESGFNNGESFSKAFYKKNGIKPSFFIKKVNENGRNL